MRPWIGCLLVVLGCGGDDQPGTVDGGVDGSTDASIAAGMVRVYARPGVRVDFMSGATDQVISTGTTDATGKIEAAIVLGDRAVIVEPQVNGMFGGVTVLDELEPEQEYRWFLEQELLFGVLVTVTWTAPATAVEYMITSRCSGQSGFVNTTTRQIRVCGPGDEILVTAFNASLVSLGSAYQVVPVSAGGETVAITAPFVADRAVQFSLATPPGISDIDATARLVTPTGLTFGDTVDLAPGTPTATAGLPMIAGDVRTQANIALPGSGLKFIIDRRPLANTIALDIDGIPLPYVASEATYDAGTSTMSWTQTGQGSPTATTVGWQDATQRKFVLVTRYTGPSVVLPVLPPDVVAVPVPSRAYPLIMASPGGYAATIRSYALAKHPLSGALTLYFSSLIGST